MADPQSPLQAGLQAVAQSTPLVRVSQALDAVGSAVQPYVERAKATMRRWTTPAPTAAPAAPSTPTTPTTPTAKRAPTARRSPTARR